jgi:hypothetical protein
MSEAPLTIFIGSLYKDESSSIYTQCMEQDTDIEYVRKDIYDKTVQNLQAELKELKIALDKALYKVPACVKELEGGVSEVIDSIEDANIMIPIEEFFNEDKTHITKNQYGKVLLKYLILELKEKYGLPTNQKANI